MNICIVIVTYNGMTWLQKCLDSCKSYSVIVVDNASTDGTLAFIAKNFAKVQVFPQSKNLGFGQANNLGISYALNQGAEQVFLLNQDAYLIDDCLEKLCDFQNDNPQFGVLSPIHVNATKDKLDVNFSNYMRHRYNPYFYSDFVLKNKLKPVYEVPFVNAAAWLISKQCLNTIGGFDPVFFHYGEDDNYCQRVTYHKLKIGVLPTSFVIHDRENREHKPINKYSEAYYRVQAKKYAIKYANINVLDTEYRIDNALLKIKRAKVKSLLKLNFTNYRNFKQEEAFLSTLKPRLLKSYTKNQLKGKHYLS